MVPVLLQLGAEGAGGVGSCFVLHRCLARENWPEQRDCQRRASDLSVISNIAVSEALVFFALDFVLVVILHPMVLMVVVLKTVEYGGMGMTNKE